jgi:hypothetical protein
MNLIATIVERALTMVTCPPIEPSTSIGDQLLAKDQVLAPHPPDELGRSASTGGRPGGRRERHRQSNRHAVRCQEMTVSGFTRRTAFSKGRKRQANAPMSHRPPCAPARAFELAADDDELLAKNQVLGHQRCPGREEGEDDVGEEAKERDHGPSAYHDGSFVARWAAVRGRVVRCGAWRPVTVGEAGADPAHVWSICDPQAGYFWTHASVVNTASSRTRSRTSLNLAGDVTVMSMPRPSVDGSKRSPRT